MAEHEHEPVTSRDLPRSPKAPSIQVTVEFCKCGCERVKSVADEDLEDIRYSGWLSKRPGQIIHHGDGWATVYDDEVLLELEETATRLAKRNLKMTVDARLLAALINEVIMNRSAAKHLQEGILEAVGDVRLTDEEQASCRDSYFALIQKALKLAREGNATAFWATRKRYDPKEFGGDGPPHRITHLVIVNASLVKLRIREKTERAKTVYVINDGGRWREAISRTEVIAWATRT